MSDAIIYLTRHGARIDSDDPHWLSKCTHNRADDPHLSAEGHTGAAELARKMQSLQQEEGWETLHIISSPYVRCVETADAVARAVGAKVKVEPGIAEVNSSRNPGFLEAVELERQFPSIDTTYAPVMARHELPIEYSDGACASRSASAAGKVLEHLGDGAPILFVGHGASCLGIAGYFGRHEYIGYTSLSKFIQGDDGGGWSCVTFGDASHLSDKQTSLDSAW